MTILPKVSLPKFTMQTFLNEEHAHFSREFKHPAWLLGLIVFTGGSVAMVATAFLCGTLTYLQQSILLQIGLIFCVFLAVFIGIPFIMRLVLNIIFRTRRIQSSGLKNLPLSYRPRSTPPPPNSPAPRWALKSFRETMAQRGTLPSLRI